MLTTQLDNLARKFEQGAVVVVKIPVIPANRVVLAVSVIVALLSASHLIAAQQHRNALGEHESG